MTHIDKVNSFIKSDQDLLEIEEKNPKIRASIHQYCKDNFLVSRTKYEGEKLMRCYECYKFQTKPQSKSLDYETSYFICEFCGEWNNFTCDYEALQEYRRIHMLKFGRFISTGEMLIFKKEKIPQYKGRCYWDESYRKRY